MTKVDHPLVGKTVDFDWRSPKEKGQVYDKWNFSVVQNVEVTGALQDCYGTIFLTSEKYNIQAASRVCKVHEENV